jgi:hypothetical protein
MLETRLGLAVEEMLLVPEQFLPTQLATPRRDSLISGERALMLAVLEDAIRCLERRRRSSRLARKAELWVRADDQQWPFSFVNVCANLDIDAGRLRAALLARRARKRMGEGTRGDYRLHLRLKPPRRRLRAAAEPRDVVGPGLPRRAARG